MRKPVSILCAQSGSVYHQIDGVEVFDLARDAYSFTGGSSVVAHPPCRGWGRFAQKAKVREGELDLALHCVGAVRWNGGVLEHPIDSKLWAAAELPAPGCADRWGFTLVVSQWWWGHQALKDSWLYVCGIAPGCVELPFRLFGSAQKDVEHMSKKQREATPPEFARWLVHLAASISPASGQTGPQAGGGS